MRFDVRRRCGKSAQWLTVGLVCLAVLTVPLQSFAQAPKVHRLGGGRYMTETVNRLPGAGLKGLHITGPANLGGQVVITAAPGDSVRVQIARVLKTESIEAAIIFAQEITTRLEPDGNVLRFDIKTPTNAPWEGTDWSARCDVTIVIPKGWDLTIKAHHFDYDLIGPFRTAVVSTEYGRINLEDVSEKTDVGGTHTPMELTNLRGEITAHTSYAKLEARGIIASAEKAAVFGNQYGAIVIEELAGAVLVKSEYAPLTLTDAVLVGSASRLIGEGSHFRVTIDEFADAQLQIQNSNADVLISVPQELSARLNLAVGRGGTIHTKNVEIQTRSGLLGRGRLEGVCGSGRGIIDIEISGAGTIDFRGD
ncbi:MAG TPA: hypothetical protein VM118_00240 [Acidobacteriota bacterium]|nr:hypothetical protein [Acidobacteriota bacterium]